VPSTANNGGGGGGVAVGHSAAAAPAGVPCFSAPAAEPSLAPGSSTAAVVAGGSLPRSASGARVLLGAGPHPPQPPDRKGGTTAIAGQVREGRSVCVLVH
jgi:hypothetical protein